MKKSILILLSVLWVIQINAQPLKPSKPDFEVSASLYPWDVHDEGINLMLDNLTGMSGVNSVYLIAVMLPVRNGMLRIHAHIFILN